VAAHTWQPPADNARIAMERHSQRLVTAFITSGMFFNCGKAME